MRFFRTSVNSADKSTWGTSPSVTSEPISSPPPLPQDLVQSSTEGTPVPSSQASPTVNLTREYTLAVQTSSYNHIWTTIHAEGQAQLASAQVVGQVLQPDRDSIREVLQQARPSNLTRLVSSYFDNSEHTSHLCLLLHRSVDRARTVYRPIGDLTEMLPTHHLTQSQCDWAFDILAEFDSQENPFPSSDSIFHEMRECFTELKQQLDRRLHKARRQVNIVRCTTKSSAICLLGTCIGAIVSSIVLAVHALPALVAAPLLVFIPDGLLKKQLDHIAQLDAAAKGTYVLNNDLDTIDRLVARLHATVESDKLLVKLGLERGRDRFPIQEVVKQLGKNHPNFLHQLKDLEEHVCLCFATVNRARGLLLQEIHQKETARRRR
ncbi:hypothetical protein H6P81_001098 [Aristolochia fimbriata]|uniref:Uncharacterized protein n=1 Tax=Aristolochia fimbriata TaxID=158543 RepID=A0AAV7F5X8_ARIFI|nr:hypothetical protein H6P81_001098 [Aristolochia fimbriata]